MTQTPLVTGSLPTRTPSLLIRSTSPHLPLAALLICKTTRPAAMLIASSSKRLHFSNFNTAIAAQLKVPTRSTPYSKNNEKYPSLPKTRQNDTIEPSSGTPERLSLFPAAFHDNLELRTCRLCSHFYGSCS